MANNYCPHPGCDRKTPTGSHCVHCRRPIDSTRTRFSGNMGNPGSIRYYWEKPIAENLAPQATKPEKKANIPWFTIGVFGNKLMREQKEAQKNQAKQSSLLEEVLKNLKK